MSIRPSARGFPERHIVRAARLAATDGALVYRSAEGASRRWPVGSDPGFVDAIHVEPTGRGRATEIGPLGFVDLRRRDFTSGLRLPLDEWTPEAADGTATPADALRLSGIADTLSTLNLPVRRVRYADDDDTFAAALAATPERAAPRAGVGGRWILLRFALALLVAVAILLAAAIRSARPDWLLVAAVGLVAVGALDLWPYALAALRERRTAPAGAARFPPRPGEPVPRGFVRSAAVLVAPDDLVVISQASFERWLPRSGPTAVTTLAVVRAGGVPRAAELRTADGWPRAHLPWSAWFGGPDGDAALADLAARANLRLDLEAAPALRGDRAPTTFAPLDADALAAAQAERRGLPPPGVFPHLVTFAALTLMLALLTRPMATPAAVLAGGVLVVAVGLRLRAALTRRRDAELVTP